jgi:hypothetical protein
MNNEERFARTCWLFCVALLGAALLIRCSVIGSASGVRDVVDLIFDDGYYYLAIAANLAQTGHSTLDGLTTTNGYQPLWLLVLSALARIVGTGQWTLFVASCVLIYVIAVCTPLLALIWRRTPWRHFALCAAAGLSLIALSQHEVFLEGLEPVLFLPLALPLIFLLESAPEPRRLLQLSAALAVAFLIRLDSLALLPASALVLSFSDTQSNADQRALPVRVLRIGMRLAIFVVPTVLVYLALNQWLCGSAVPVSGMAKMIGGPKFSNWGIAQDFFSRWKSFLLLLALLAPLEWLARAAGKWDRAFLRAFAAISLAALAQWAYYSAFSTWNVWPWYSYLVALDMAIVIARIIHLGSLLCVLPRARFAVVPAVGLIAAWTVYRGGLFVARSLPAQARATLPAMLRVGMAPAGARSFNDVSLSMLDAFFGSRPHTVIAMGDRAGGLAYWGRTRVSIVQTEGLTLDAHYIAARVADRGAEYLESRYPIEFYVIDREYVPTLSLPGAETLYIVADPIQGRITTAPVPTFCFPASAVKYDVGYPAQYGRNRRMAFEFAARRPCPPQGLRLVRTAALQGGLRRFSLPSEYPP